MPARMFIKFNSMVIVVAFLRGVVHISTHPCKWVLLDVRSDMDWRPYIMSGRFDIYPLIKEKSGGVGLLF